MANGRHRWLHEQISHWEQSGWVDAETAGRLRAAYPVRQGPARSAAVAGFAVFGALLAGGGLILLLAHNWPFLSRPARFAVSLLPLLSAQGLALWAIAQSRRSPAWREGIGLFWSLAVGITLAMVSQSYHISAELDDFFLAWALLILPIAYLLPSGWSGVIYLALAVAWSLPPSEEWFKRLLLWPMILAVCPAAFRRDTMAQHSAGGFLFLQWAFAISILLATAVASLDFWRGFLVPLYGTLFSLFIAVDLIASSAPDQSLRRRPFRVLGTIGGLVLLFCLTFDEVWRGVYPSISGHADGTIPWLEKWFDPALAILWTLAAVTIFVRRGGEWASPSTSLIAIGTLVLLLYVARGNLIGSGVAALLCNLLIVMLGGSWIAVGLKRNLLAWLNGGFALWAVLAVLRFFDSDWPLLVRGFAFSAVGIALLILNAALARRLRRAR